MEISISSPFLVAHPISVTDSCSTLSTYLDALQQHHVIHNNSVSGSCKQLQEIILYSRDASTGSTSLHIHDFQKSPKHFWKPLPTLIARETFIKLLFLTNIQFLFFCKEGYFDSNQSLPDI